MTIRRKTNLFLFPLLAGLLALGSCSDGSTETAASPALSDEGHGLHVVNSPRLRAIMEELRGLRLAEKAGQASRGRLPEDMELAAELAAALARDARMIPQLFRDTQMTDESRRVFDNLASRMADQCIDLRNLTRGDDSQAVSRKLDEIITTCNACHSSFRGPMLATATR